ncbi:GNAT family N-acetyltransferase [Sphingomonas bacterium]|uniref:GNAT family N-acetyltransferase n=1 Tax=Sphingomonas bacterium TaxID=1895847 RepID=UPI0015752721|nr:GNAT family N-acetyltransferase [Sphingomonas bacterium]
MTAPTVRHFRPDDAPALAAIFHAAVHGLAARDYSPEQRRAWSATLGDPARWTARAADGRTTLVAVDAADKPIAYADLERDGHIDQFYRHPDHPSCAATLYHALEAVARAWGLARLHTEASEPARRFLERRGFVAAARRDFVLHGVSIHNWAMAKPLGPA